MALLSMFSRPPEPEGGPASYRWSSDSGSRQPLLNAEWKAKRHQRAIAAAALYLRSLAKDAPAAPNLTELRKVERKAKSLSNHLATMQSRSRPDDLSADQIDVIKRLQGMVKRLTDAIEIRVSVYRR